MKNKPTKRSKWTRQLLVLSLLWSTGFCYAQKNRADSVQKILHQKNLHDTLRARNMVFMAMYTEKSNPVLAHQLYRKSLDFSLGKRLYYYAGLSLRQESTFYGEERKWDAQKWNLRQALTYFGKNNTPAAQKEIGKTYLDLGTHYRKVALYDSAIAASMKGTTILEKIKGFDLTKSYINLATIYEDMDRTDKQKEYLQKALAAAKKSGNPKSLFNGYLRQVHYLSKVKQNEQSRKYLDSARLYFNKNYNFAEVNSFYLLSAYLEQQSGNYDSAVHYYALSYDYAKKHNAVSNMIEAKNQIAYNYALQKKYKDAEMTTKEALTMALKDSNKLAMREEYAILNHIYSETGRYKEAEEMLWNYIDMDAIIINEDKKKFILNLEKKYETEKKEAQIKLQQARIRQKNTLNYILAGGALALIAFASLSYRNYRHRQKLQQQRITELETEKQLFATEAVLKGEEQERSRLAKDLHDGLGGMLSGIKLSLNTMKGNLIMTSENADAFEMSIGMLDNTIREMRRVAHNMMPEMLVKYGLDTALKELCSEISRSTGLHANYQSLEMDKVDVEQSIAIAIYRIVQELSGNTIKHSGAKNLLVQIHALPDEKQLAITVEDDGNGFDPQQLETATGMGWMNIRNRVDFLKGKLDLHSAPGTGTSVLIEINY